MTRPDKCHLWTSRSCWRLVPSWFHALSHWYVYRQLSESSSNEAPRCDGEKDRKPVKPRKGERRNVGWDCQRYWRTTVFHQLMTDFRGNLQLFTTAASLPQRAVKWLLLIFCMSVVSHQCLFSAICWYLINYFKHWTFFLLGNLWNGDNIGEFDKTQAALG